MSQENVEIVRRGFAAVRAGDLEAVAEILAPDVKWHGGDPDDKYGCHDRQEVIEFMRARRGKGVGELLEVIDAGDRVVVVMQPPEQEGEVPSPRANVTTFRDGLVVEMIHFESPEAALAHVGRPVRERTSE